MNKCVLKILIFLQLLTAGSHALAGHVTRESRQDGARNYKAYKSHSEDLQGRYERDLVKRREALDQRREEYQSEQRQRREEYDRTYPSTYGGQTGSGYSYESNGWHVQQIPESYPQQIPAQSYPDGWGPVQQAPRHEATKDHPLPIDDTYSAENGDEIPRGAIGVYQEGGFKRYVLAENFKPENVTADFIKKSTDQDTLFDDRKVTPEILANAQNILELSEGFQPLLSHPVSLPSPQGCDLFFGKGTDGEVSVYSDGAREVLLATFQSPKSAVCRGELLGIIAVNAEFGSALGKKAKEAAAKVAGDDTYPTYFLINKSGLFRYSVSKDQHFVRDGSSLSWQKVAIAHRSGKEVIRFHSDRGQYNDFATADGTEFVVPLSTPAGCEHYDFFGAGGLDLSVINKSGSDWVTISGGVSVACHENYVAFVAKKISQGANHFGTGDPKGARLFLFRDERLIYTSPETDPSYQHVSVVAMKDTAPFFRFYRGDANHANSGDISLDGVPQLLALPNDEGCDFRFDMDAQENLIISLGAIQVAKPVKLIDFACRGENLAILSGDPEKATAFVFVGNDLVATRHALEGSSKGSDRSDSFSRVTIEGNNFRIWPQTMAYSVVIDFSGTKAKVGMGRDRNSLGENHRLKDWETRRLARRDFVPPSAPVFRLATVALPNTEEFISAGPEKTFHGTKFEMIRELFAVAKPVKADFFDRDQRWMGICSEVGKPTETVDSVLAAYVQKEGRYITVREEGRQGRWDTATFHHAQDPTIVWTRATNSAPFPGMSADDLSFFWYKYLRGDDGGQWIGVRLRQLEGAKGARAFVSETYWPWHLPGVRKLSQFAPTSYCVFAERVWAERGKRQR